MKHAILETDKGSRLVDAQGHLIQTADGDRRILHVLPKLYVDDPALCCDLCALSMYGFL